MIAASPRSITMRETMSAETQVSNALTLYAWLAWLARGDDEQAAG